MLSQWCTERTDISTIFLFLEERSNQPFSFLFYHKYVLFENGLGGGERLELMFNFQPILEVVRVIASNPNGMHTSWFYMNVMQHTLTL